MSDAPKARYGVFLVYPESAPEDWWSLLKASHGSYARSPLHEPDDEVSQPHYHVIYKHSNTVTLDAMKRVIPAGIAANGYVELCAHPRNYQRYLVHLDDPDKQQWAGDPRELIETCNGFPLDLTRDFSQAERAEQRREVFQLIRDNGICEYADLLEGLMDNGMYDLFDYAFNHTIAFSHYLASRRGRSSGVDPDGSGSDSDRGEASAGSEA